MEGRGKTLWSEDWGKNWAKFFEKAKTVAKSKNCQNIYIKAEFERTKHLHQS
jgi:hypothetical protein